ncbi:hypothetical protein [Actinomadura coerulea]|uniref:hypothetical protein n=1 Tax=Actinomadura coerulea TaxID=46159 RepID=UPI00342D4E47
MAAPKPPAARAGLDRRGVPGTGLLAPPIEPVNLPADVPAALRPYRGPSAWQPGNLLDFAAHIVITPARYPHDLPYYDRDRLHDAYCRAGLAMVASTGHGGPMPLRARMACGLPLIGGYVAALAVARTWRSHPESRDDITLHQLLASLITAVWPTPRCIAAPGPALSHAMALHRHLRVFYGTAGPQRHDIHKGIDQLRQVGAATGGRARQIALWHLTRAAYQAVRTCPDASAVQLGAALLDALPDDDAERTR